ncbi:MAG TPA: hypothetical protein VH475_00120, partial [Tepidisphaeraceae bacterium]
ALYLGGSATAAEPGAGVFNVESSSTATFAGPTKLWTGGTLNVAGGTFRTQSVQNAGGTFNFNSGALYLTGSDFTLGAAGVIGPTLTLASGPGARNTLSVSGTTTLDPGASLTISGGTFTTGKLVNNGASFAFSTGSLSLTNDNFTIGAGSLLGSTVNLTTGRSLSVSGVVTIDPGASLTVNGGSFSAASLVNNGSFNFLSGTLGGSADLVIDPGQLLGPNVTLGAGRHLTAAQALVVGKTGTATMTINGGGSTGDARGYIAQQAGSNGSVSVSGAGSLWSNTATLAVGGSDSVAGGTATLNISGGAAVSAGSAVTIYPSATVTVDSASLTGASIANRGMLQLIDTATVGGTLTNTGTIRKTGAGAARMTGALNNNATLQVLGGKLTLANGAGNSAGAFAVDNGATLEFAGTRTFDPNSILGPTASLTGAGSALFSGGDHVFNGAFNLAQVTIADADAQITNDATINHLILTGGTPTQYPGIYLSKTLAVQTFDYAGGQIGPGATTGGTINVSGPINITGDDWKTIDKTTINASGNTLWTGNGRIAVTGGAVFNNLANATFEARHLAGAALPVFGSGGGAGVFNNYGTFLKSTGAVFVDIESTFNNYGTVTLQTGSLQLAGGGMHTGSISAASGTKLVIGNQLSSPTTFAPSSSITSAGDVQFLGAPAGGEIGFSGHYNVAGTTSITQASFLAGADLQSLGAALLINGTANFSTGIPQTLPPTTLGYELARLNSADDLTTAAPLNWVGGFISGTGHLRLNAGGTLSSTAQKTLVNGTLDNAGTVVWSGGTFNQRGTLNNLAGATFDIRGSDAMEFDLAAPPPFPAFNNAGRVVKSAGNSTNIYPFFTNSGSVDVQAGQLNFARGSSATGSYSVTKGAALNFVFADYTFEPSSSIMGNGDVGFLESNATFRGRYAVSGSTTVGSSTASGTTTLLSFEPGSTATDLGTQVTINTYGTLALNTGKTVNLHDLTLWGTLTGTDRVVLSGQVTGRGTMRARVVNAGRFSPGASPGTLNVDGDYAQEPAASLQVELAPPSTVGPKYVQQFDVLKISGHADLAGTLEVALLDGFAPASGETFRILTAASRAGQFTQLRGALLGPAGDADHVRYAAPAYDATGVTLTVTQRLLGDANLDGSVDFNDLVPLAQHYDGAPDTPDPWQSGDFTGDGLVDFNDLVPLAQHYQTHDGAVGTTPQDLLSLLSGAAAVPEPGVIVPLALIAAASRRRARRQGAVSRSADRR